MRTKLSAFCDGIIEAGWLLSLILVPVFFDFFSTRVFEPDKIALLQSIVIVMLFAWIVKKVELSGQDRISDTPAKPSLLKFLFDTPIIMPVTMLFIAYILSTVLSVLPHISLWGSYDRGSGAVSMASYIFVFFMIFDTLSQKEQVGRLIDIIILTSVPISIYGILQHSGYDPISWTMDFTKRVGSTLGNPIFAAAYMIMVLPLTLDRLIESLMELREGKRRGFVLLTFICYGLVLLLQGVFILFTQSRGPWLGLLGGLYIFILVILILLSGIEGGRLSWKDAGKAFLFSVASIPVGILPAYILCIIRKKGLRCLPLGFVFHTVFFVVFLLFLNLPFAPLSSLRENRYLGRLSQLGDTQSGTAKVRLLVWEGTVNLIGSSFPRALVGYGPDTMKYVWGPYTPSLLTYYEPSRATADRSHNETLDSIVSTGIIGFLAYILLFVSIFYYGLKWLGILTLKKQGILFVSLALFGVTGGAFLPKLIQGSYTLSGIGVSLGLVCGIFIYLIITALVWPLQAQTRENFKRSVLYASLVSAIFAHFIEINFGIAIASTRLYLFVYAAILTRFGLGSLDTTQNTNPEGDEKSPRPEHKHKHKRRQTQNHTIEKKEELVTKKLLSRLECSVLFYALVVSTILLSIGFPSLTIRRENGIWQDIWKYIMGESSGSGASDAMYPVFISAFLAGGYLLADWCSKNFAPHDIRWGRMLLRYTGYCAVFFFVGISLIAYMLKIGGNIGFIIVLYFASIGILAIAIAIVVFLDNQPEKQSRRMDLFWLYGILGILAIWGITSMSITPLKANIYQRVGIISENQGRTDMAIYWFNRAIKLDPEQDYYYLALGRAMFAKANSAQNRSAKEALLGKIPEILEQAQKINPLNPDHPANLAMIYVNWAHVDSSENGKKEKLEKAHTLFAKATERSPYKALIYNNWARAYMEQKDYESAMKKIQYALSSDKNFPGTYRILGDIYAQQQKMPEAMKAYEKALEFEPKNVDLRIALGYIYQKAGQLDSALSMAQEAVKLRPDSIKAHSLLGLLYFNSGRMEESLQETLKLVQLQPKNLAPRSNLVTIYERLGRFNDALNQIEEMIGLSSESEKTTLRKKLEEIKRKMK